MQRQATVSNYLGSHLQIHLIFIRCSPICSDCYSYSKVCQACEQEDDLSTDLFIPKKLNTNKKVLNNKKATVSITYEEDTIQDIQTSKSDNNITSNYSKEDDDYNKEEIDIDNNQLHISEFNDEEEQVPENDRLSISEFNDDNINEIHNVNESDNITTISNKSTKKKKGSNKINKQSNNQSYNFNGKKKEEKV